MLTQTGYATKSGYFEVGDEILRINGDSMVGIEKSVMHHLVLLPTTLSALHMPDRSHSTHAVPVFTWGR